MITGDYERLRYGSDDDEIRGPLFFVVACQRCWMTKYIHVTPGSLSYAVRLLKIITLEFKADNFDARTTALKHPILSAFICGLTAATRKYT